MLALYELRARLGHYLIQLLPTLGIGILAMFSLLVIPAQAAAPAISSVSPNPVTGSNSTQPFTINGSNFVSGANITLRDLTANQTFANRVASSFTSTQIVINPDFTTAVHTWSVEVINPNGQTTGQFQFQVVAAASPPAISSVSPNPVTGSNSTQPFTINGSNFVSGANITLRDLTANQTFANRVASSFTSTQIVINPDFTTAVHTWSVEVINPNGQTTGQFQFQVVAPVSPPTISSVSPNPVTGSNSTQPFTINGSNFVSGANITLRDLTANQTFANRVASSFTSTQIVINPDFTTAADTWSVEVINPNGQTTGQFQFQVVAPVSPPAIGSVSPNPVIGSNNTQPFTINGSNFVSGANITLRDLTANQIFANRVASSFTSTQIVINPDFTTAVHIWSVEVINPNGQTSGQFQFQVVAPASQPILSVSPPNPSVAATAGSTSLVVTNAGSGTLSYTAAVTNGSWLAITSGGSGGNGGIINVSFSANTGPQRSGTIQVTASGASGSPATVTITQAAAGSQSLVFGIDSSSIQQQGAIDWTQVKSSPISDSKYNYPQARVSFVILRASRGNPNDPADAPTAACPVNGAFADPAFNGPQFTRAADATSAGLTVGAYHLATIYNDLTNTPTSAAAEADFFVNSVAGQWIKPGNLRPFLDLENDTTDACGGLNRMNYPGLVAWVDAWMKEVKLLTGVTPIIYTYRYIASDPTNPNNIAALASAPYNNGNGYELWFAEDADPATVPNVSPWKVDLVQYDVNSGYVTGGSNGALVHVDLDAFQGDQNAFQAVLTIPSGNVAPAITQQPLGQLAAAGQSATFIANAAGTPTPTVQWQQSTDNGASFQNIPGATSNTLSFTAALSQNGYQYRAMFSNSGGSTTTQAAALTVIPAASFTTTAIMSSANPSTYGQSVTFTATVTPSGGTPTGTVTFYDSATQLGTGTLSNGMATFPAASLSLGNHSITAVYGGDSNFAGSNSSVLSQIVIQNLTLAVSLSGNGTVASSPSGINCGSTCSASFNNGTFVTLTATPASGWSFTGWAGACSGTGACSVTVNAAQSVSATFSPSFSGGTWTAVTTAPSSGLSNPLLLTDGTVIVHVMLSQSWYKLTPDINGNYASGTWSPIASLPSGYGPLYFSSAVLPGGRVIMQGGEYNLNCPTTPTAEEAWTSLGAIYDPVANTWTSVSPPSGNGWTNTLSCGSDNGGVGDAPSIILPNGTFLLGSCCACPAADALLDANSLTYASTGAPSDLSLGPNCKSRTFQSEQGYTLLPNGNVLTIDVWNPPNAQQYNPTAGTWADVASTPVSLVDPAQCGHFEIGPAVTRPDGTTVAFGGNTGVDSNGNPGCTSSSADPTAIYTTSSNSWVQGPDVPAVCGVNGTTSCDLADAPAALLPDGNILFAAGAGFGTPPTHFFEFTSGNIINQVADPPFNPSKAAFAYNFLVLPKGQIFMTDFSSVAGVYTPVGSANPGWAPVISSVPTSLVTGQTYQVSGTQLNGLSQGAAYGDDVQAATNYPLVRITNNATAHVFYARTFNHSTMSIAPNTAGSTNFTVAANVEPGASSLVVVANGIASQAIAVNISNTPTLSVSVTGSGTVTSNPSGINCPSTCSAGFSSGTNVTLTASAAGGWVFSGWSGACSGTGGCAATMTAAHSVTATFTPLFMLAVSVTGSGTVTSSPGGVSCPSTCGANYAAGTPVTLTATPANGYGFEGWIGACSGFGNCVVTMNAAQSVTATFTVPGETLNVSVSGSGTVSSSPSGISCPSLCTMNYASSTPVTLTATPSGGATFSGWGGACSGNGSCVVTMNSIESVSAMFSSPGGSSPTSRTWVSATLGNDANPCTRSAPCLTFAAALTLTAAGGEIDVLDPGDFGPLTIAQSISIQGYETEPSGMTAMGTSTIVINAGSNDVIDLRGLTFNGADAAGMYGVVFNSGARLHIQNCTFQGFGGAGIVFSPGTGSAATAEIVVQDTTAVDNGAGVLVKPTGGVAARVGLSGVELGNNIGGGIKADGTGGSGAIILAVADSSISLNAGNGINAVSGQGNVTINMTRVAVVANGLTGVQSNQDNGGMASVTIGASIISGNGVGLAALGGGSLLSYGNNRVVGNGTNGTFTGIAGFQ